MFIQTKFWHLHGLALPWQVGIGAVTEGDGDTDMGTQAGQESSDLVRGSEGEEREREGSGAVLVEHLRPPASLPVVPTMSRTVETHLKFGDTEIFSNVLLRVVNHCEIEERYRY